MYSRNVFSVLVVQQITPAHDTRMKPTEIGVPITMATKMYESILIGQLASISLNSRNSGRNRNDLVQALLLCSKRDKARFIKFWDSKLIGTFAYNGKQAYDTVTKLIYDVVEEETISQHKLFFLDGSHHCISMQYVHTCLRLFLKIPSTCIL